MWGAASERSLLRGLVYSVLLLGLGLGAAVTVVFGGRLPAAQGVTWIVSVLVGCLAGELFP